MTNTPQSSSSTTTTPTFSPKNLVLQGGGIKGVAYVGVAEALEEQGIYQHVERVAGTSAGSIFAALMALGYGSADMRKLVLDTNFKKFEDGTGPIRTVGQTLNKYGVFKGKYFLNWMKKAVKNAPIKGLKPNATFTDLRNKGGLDLRVFATDLNEKNAQEFSFEKTPNVIVAEAVRASMSIPLAFEAFQFTKGTMPDESKENHLFVDGGIVLNYPIDTFDVDGHYNPETLGFAFHDPPKMGKNGKDAHLEYGHLIEYAKILHSTRIQAQEVEYFNNPSEQARTIKVDDLGVSAFDFGVSKETKLQLMASGKKGTVPFLKKKKQEAAQQTKKKSSAGSSSNSNGSSGSGKNKKKTSSGPKKSSPKTTTKNLPNQVEINTVNTPAA